MSAIDAHDTPGGSGRFAPTLNLKDIRERVESLSEGQFDTIAYILDGDTALCSVTKTSRLHLEDYLKKMYLKLGIINSNYSSNQKRKAAALMNKIYDSNGWRPDQADTDFLLAAFTNGLEAPAEQAPDHSKTPAPLPPDQKGQQQAPVESSPAAGDSLPPVADIVASIHLLTPWRLRFLEWVANGVDATSMLTALRSEDASADQTTVDSNLRKLFKSLGLPGSYESGAVPEAIKEAYSLYQQQKTVPEGPASTPQIEEPSERSPAVAATEEKSDPEIEAIVRRISKQIELNKVTPRRIQILDLLLTKNYADTAKVLDTTESNVGQAVGVLRDLFQIPKGSSSSVRLRGTEERKVLMSAWRLYRERGALPEADAIPVSDASLEPGPPASTPELPAVSEEPPEVSVEETPEPPSPEAEPVSPPQAEAAPVPTSAGRTSIVSGSGALLRDPSTILGVRTLWSTSPSFDNDQSKALGEGYAIEHIENLASFHPVICGVSVLVLVKRS